MTHESQNACSDLEAFVVSKYDPLLTIVKELNENLQHLERGNTLLNMANYFRKLEARAQNRES